MKARLRNLLPVFFTILVLILSSDIRHAATKAPKYMKLEQVGQLPDMFREAVENNRFRGVCAFESVLLRSERLYENTDERSAAHKVQMTDLWGNPLAEYTCIGTDACSPGTLTATEDGGFLFVLGFSERSYVGGGLASDGGFASRVIKCDRDGKMQFDTSFDSVEGYALCYCIESDGRYYFFGTARPPEARAKGRSHTDIYMAVLGSDGDIIDSRYIGGSDFDSLDAAESSEGGFLLSVSAQSNDGIFSGSDSGGYPACWTLEVSPELEILDAQQRAGRDYFDRRIGQRNGTPIYNSTRLPDGNSLEDADAFIDYGDYYMLISENITGEYEHTLPYISSVWYYTETVYSAYDYSGRLLFRATADSTPDYDSISLSLTTND